MELLWLFLLLCFVFFVIPMIIVFMGEGQNKSSSRQSNKGSATATASGPRNSSGAEPGEHAIEQLKQMMSKGVEGLLACTVAETLLENEHVIDTVFGRGKVSMNDHVPLSGQGVELVLALTNMRNRLRSVKFGPVAWP